jgi:hypothetical protein
MSCANNDMVPYTRTEDISPSGGFQRSSCGPGFVNKPEWYGPASDFESPTGTAPYTNPLNGKQWPYFPTVDISGESDVAGVDEKDNNKCAGAACTVSDCCTQMTCANNNGQPGFNNTFITKGFTATLCGANRQPKPSPWTHVCTGRICTNEECCEPITCANNDDKTGRQYTNTGFLKPTCGNGWVLKTRTTFFLSSKDLKS